MLPCLCSLCSALTLAAVVTILCLCVQDSAGFKFVVQGQLVQCGLSESETCLKSVTLALSGGANVSMIHSHINTALLFPGYISVHFVCSVLIYVTVGGKWRTYIPCNSMKTYFHVGPLGSSFSSRLLVHYAAELVELNKSITVNIVSTQLHHLVSSFIKVITIQPDGKVFVNGIYAQLPFSAGKRHSTPPLI